MLEAAERVEIADVVVLNDTDLVLYCRVGEEIVRCRPCESSLVPRSSTRATGGGSSFRTTSLSSSASPRPVRDDAAACRS